MSFQSVESIRKEGQERVDAEEEARIRWDDQAIMWWALDYEPGEIENVGFIDEGSVLFKNLEKLGIYPFKTRGDKYLIFDAQYKIASWDNPVPPEVVEAVAAGSVEVGVAQNTYLIMSFVAGFQIEATEMMMVIGEYSSQPGDGEKRVEPQDGGGEKTAPKPPKWFEWPEEEKIMVNKLYKRTKKSQNYGMEVYIFRRRAQDLQKHWWIQMVLYGEGSVCTGDRNFPIPGEFIGLGVRMLRGLPWGEQKSSPFIYAGNWIDGIYITSGVIKGVIDPSAAFPFFRYEVEWHKLMDRIIFLPSDFCEYKIEDRVTILKDVSVTKKYQSSEDDDAKADCDKKGWQIVPLTFYSDQGKQEA